MVLAFGEVLGNKVGKVSAIIVKLTFQGSEIGERNKQKIGIVSDGNKYYREKP